MLKRFALAVVACLWASLACAQAIPPGITSQEFAVLVGGSGTTAGVTVQLPAAQGKNTFVCGFSISPGSATTAITITVGLTGIASPFSWVVGAPATAAGTTGAIFSQTFTPCIPSIALNTAVQLQLGALGAGGVQQSANIWGYQFGQQ